VNAFRDELARGAQLSAEYLIVHPGSVRGGDVARAIENVAEGIARAVRGLAAGPATAPGSRPPRVLIENTAGQGTALGSCLEELCRLLYACGARGVTPRPGVCLDTAHLLAAGYEIRTPEGLEKTLAAVDSVIGLENVFAIHVNDSKAPIGSRVDRHEHIGRGHIGRQAFAHILNHPRLRSATRVFLLETPIDRPGDDRRNVRTLWKLLGREAPVVKIRSAVRPARSKRVAHKLQARRRHAARKVSRRASRRSPRREN
jgi:deoxyribonuclease-4